MSWSVDVFVWHGDLATALMANGGCRSSAVLWNQSNGPRSARCGLGAGGQCDAVGSAGIRAHHVHQQGQADLQFSSKSVMSTIAKLVEITRSRLRKISQYLEDQPVLEFLHAYQNEVAECMAFGDRDWAGDRETAISNGGAGEAGKPSH